MVKNRISVIPCIFKTSVVQDVELKEVLLAIKKGCAYKKDLIETTKMIQAEPDHSKRDFMKKSMLPVAMFNGTFSYKNDQSIKEYSSFTAIDLDNFTSKTDMDNAKNMLMMDSCVYAVYITPSGRGLKAIILRDNLLSDYHGELYEQLLDKFPFSVTDKSVRDLSRGNYICYDPDIYINYSPVPYHFIHNPAYIPKTKSQSPRAGLAYDIQHLRLMLGFMHPAGNKSDESIIAILNCYWKKQPQRWRIGNRKNSVFQAASELCQAGVNIDKALDYLVKEYEAVGLTVDDIMYQAIRGYQCNFEVFGVNRKRFDSYGSQKRP